MRKWIENSLLYIELAISFLIPVYPTQNCSLEDLVESNLEKGNFRLKYCAQSWGRLLGVPRVYTTLGVTLGDSGSIGFAVPWTDSPSH